MANAVVMALDDDLEIRMISREYVAAIALATGRSKDRNRLIQLREEGKLDMQKFHGIIDTHGLTAKWEQFQSLFPIENNETP